MQALRVLHRNSRAHDIQDALDDIVDLEDHVQLAMDRSAARAAARAGRQPPQRVQDDVIDQGRRLLGLMADAAASVADHGVPPAHALFDVVRLLRRYDQATAEARPVPPSHDPLRAPQSTFLPDAATRSHGAAPGAAAGGARLRWPPSPR